MKWSCTCLELYFCEIKLVITKLQSTMFEVPNMQFSRKQKLAVLIGNSFNILKACLARSCSAKMCYLKSCSTANSGHHVPYLCLHTMTTNVLHNLIWNLFLIICEDQNNNSRLAIRCSNRSRIHSKIHQRVSLLVPAPSVQEPLTTRNC